MHIHWGENTERQCMQMSEKKKMMKIQSLEKKIFTDIDFSVVFSWKGCFSLSRCLSLSLSLSFWNIFTFLVYVFCVGSIMVLFSHSPLFRTLYGNTNVHLNPTSKRMIWLWSRINFSWVYFMLYILSTFFCMIHRQRRKSTQLLTLR